MRFLRVLVTLPLWFLLVAEASPTPTPVPTSPPAPTPIYAFLTLDVTSGPPNTAITVQGGQFNPNQKMTLYWDQADRVAGSAMSDANGNFTAKVKPFDGDKPGVHKLCASVQPNPCANFNLEAAAAPSPSPSPVPSPSPEATPSPVTSAAPSTTPAATTLNGFEVISRPPFVFLPLIGIVALIISLGYWVLTMVRRPRTISYPSAAVVHRASRPDYSAEFGTPPPTPASAPSPSAWEDVVPKVPVPPQQPEPEPPQVMAPEPQPVVAEASPAYEWPELPAPDVQEEMRKFLSPPDEPLELPKPRN